MTFKVPNMSADEFADALRTQDIDSVIRDFMYGLDLKTAILRCPSVTWIDRIIKGFGGAYGFPAWGEFWTATKPMFEIFDEETKRAQMVLDVSEAEKIYKKQIPMLNYYDLEYALKIKAYNEAMRTSEVRYWDAKIQVAERLLNAIKNLFEIVD